MRIAVTGKNGQVVRALVETAAAGMEGVLITPVRRLQLDLAVSETILPALRAERPDAVINTAVDKAETEPDAALSINGAGAVVSAAAELRCRCCRSAPIAFSTAQNPCPMPRPTLSVGSAPMAAASFWASMRLKPSTSSNPLASYSTYRVNNCSCMMASNVVTLCVMRSTN
jgi:hypothetical protein